jgi:hypothetical protein
MEHFKGGVGDEAVGERVGEVEIGERVGDVEVGERVGEVEVGFTGDFVSGGGMAVSVSVGPVGFGLTGPLEAVVGVGSFSGSG